MYAITFELDAKLMEEHYEGTNWREAYAEIGAVLRDHGFGERQGRLYIGDATVNAVTCVTAVQAVSRTTPWFAPAVRTMRMFRVSEMVDLGPAVAAG